MQSPLSLLVQLKAPLPAQHAESLSRLFVSNTDNSSANANTNILHYACLTVLPASFGNYAFLSTVYDGDFYDYVKVLVVANPQAFDFALSLFVGGEAYMPVMQHLDDFINVFVKDHDLAQNPQGSKDGFVPNNPNNKPNPQLFQAYFWNVTDILTEMGRGDVATAKAR